MNLSELKEIFGERLSTADSIREHHSSDESWHIPEKLPDAVIFPNNSEEVSLIIKFANDKGIPIIPYGAGTSLEGHVHAVNGGITINTMNMNKILNINLFINKFQGNSTIHSSCIDMNESQTNCNSTCSTCFS